MSGCAQERDCLFALFPLAKEKHLGATVDYSLPWWQVYTDFARLKVETNTVSKQAARLLNQVSIWGSLANFNATLPSWVPNWRNQPLEENIHSYFPYIYPLRAKAYGTALAISEAIIPMVTFVFARCPNDLSTSDQIREYVTNQLDTYMASILRGATRQNPILNSAELRYIRNNFIGTLLWIIKAVDPSFVLRHRMPKYNSHANFSLEDRNHIGDLLYPLFPDPNAKFTLFCIENKLHHAKQESPETLQCQVCQDMVSTGLFISVGNAMRDRTMFVSTGYYRKSYGDSRPYDSLYLTYFWTSAANVSIEDGVLPTIFFPTALGGKSRAGGMHGIAGMLLKPIRSGVHGENSGGGSSDEAKINSSQISSDLLRNISSDVAQRERVFRISEPCHCSRTNPSGKVIYDLDRADIVII
ncbi:hypothetical protein L207DRAFT_260044 [Hyaloscypha variabilis F]|uniref:Uncharacterized protein n=1 Tax=Hyaloscypha variabilis (strain UAMH 11265 / GT02V1 / F) TaxID=1149755 RepID=A0A2J6S4U2_HYAVF|nr:hypothetical protein L207DRAFT_260044 [Hyaloscypha variabilis F]